MKCTVSTAIFLFVGVVNIKSEEISWADFSAKSRSLNLNLTWSPLLREHGSIPLGSPQVGYTDSTSCGSTSGTLPDMRINE